LDHALFVNEDMSHSVLDGPLPDGAGPTDLFRIELCQQFFEESISGLDGFEKLGFVHLEHCSASITLLCRAH
jgi:hypothetical protein